MTDEAMTDEGLITAALEQMPEALPDVDADAETETAEDPEPEAEEASEPESAEPPKEEEPKPEEPKLSKALARVARREASVLELETQVRQREESLTAREQQIETASKRWAELTDLGKRDPVRFLQEAGVDIDQLSRQLVSGEAPAKPDPVQKELAEIKAKLEAREQTDAGYQEQQRQAAAARHRHELETFVAARPEGIPFVIALPPARAAAAMQQIVQGHWAKTKIVLDAKEASRILNGQLEEHYKTLSTAATQQPAAAPHEPKGTKPPGTVTKSHRSRTAKIPGRDVLSDEELVEAALKLEW